MLHMTVLQKWPHFCTKRCQKEQQTSTQSSSMMSYTVLDELTTIPLERIKATMPNTANTFIYNIFLQPALDIDITLYSLLQSFTM